jgi:hypothetical protein
LVNWPMAVGQWPLVNGHWSMVNGQFWQWPIVNGHWSVGQWSIFNWSMALSAKVASAVRRGNGEPTQQPGARATIPFESTTYT